MTYTTTDLTADVLTVHEEHPDYTPDQIAAALETTVPLREVGKILLEGFVEDVFRREHDQAMAAAVAAASRQV